MAIRAPSELIKAAFFLTIVIISIVDNVNWDDDLSCMLSMSNLCGGQSDQYIAGQSDQ